MYEIFRVLHHHRAPLVAFIEDALRGSGCSLIARSPDGEAPFRLSFITPWGERMGIIAYAFLANSKLTKNRPSDEHRFQVKYGSKDGKYHELWRDPFGLYTTLFLGINPELGIFVGADPVLNSPTRFFISKEFKQEHVDRILADGWHAWEREQRRDTSSEPREVLVGGTAEHFLRYVLFEREAVGEDQGHRQLVAERFDRVSLPTSLNAGRHAQIPLVSTARLHELEREFDLRGDQIMELIASAPRLKMAVRGWVAEQHLHAQLQRLPEVREVESIEKDGQPDFRVIMRRGRRPVLVECKNVLRATDRNGRPRLDFMRTRASLGDPCSRYYSPHDFDVVAACLHARTEKWEFAARRTAEMEGHRECRGKLHHRLLVDDAWQRDLSAVLMAAAS